MQREGERIGSDSTIKLGDTTNITRYSALSSPEIGPRLVIAVDDDIDPDDLRDVSWSFASRVHAEFDVQAIDGLPDSVANGDYILFGAMGAYTVSSRSPFNGYYPDSWAVIA